MRRTLVTFASFSNFLPSHNTKTYPSTISLIAMPVIPSLRLSPDQLEKYSCKAAVVSEYYLNQINGILIELCDDQKVSAPQSKTEGEPTATKTKAGLVTNTRKSFAKKQSKARPASETTDLKSLLGIDISSEASATVISTASSLHWPRPALSQAPLQAREARLPAAANRLLPGHAFQLRP